MKNERGMILLKIRKDFAKILIFLWYFEDF
jgi:hypothetical protein